MFCSTATATISNTGSLAGATVAQLYLSLPQIPGEGSIPLRVLEVMVMMMTATPVVIAMDTPRLRKQIFQEYRRARTPEVYVEEIQAEDQGQYVERTYHSTTESAAGKSSCRRSTKTSNWDILSRKLWSGHKITSSKMQSKLTATEIQCTISDHLRDPEPDLLDDVLWDLLSPLLIFSI